MILIGAIETIGWPFPRSRIKETECLHQRVNYLDSGKPQEVSILGVIGTFHYSIDDLILNIPNYSS
jgi:hypothetical protein